MGILNFTYLNEVTGNDPETLKQILVAYTTHLPSDVQEFKKLVLEGNYQQAGFLAHKIKSSARILGLESAIWLAEIEKAAKTQTDLFIIDQKMPMVEKNLNDALAEIAGILNG